MLVLDSGPHIKEYLTGRIRSLTEALEAAQARINELERAFGTDTALMPLIVIGFTRTQSKILHLLRTRDFVTGEQIQFAMYADNPDHMHEIDARAVMKCQITYMRRLLERFGVAIESVGYGKGSSGYLMRDPDKSRLERLVASGARLESAAPNPGQGQVEAQG